MIESINRHVYDIFYDGQALSDFGVHCSGDKTFGSATKVIETFEVDGRNGELTFDKNRFENVDLSYDCFIGENLDLNLRGLYNLLYGSKGYHRLEDSYHTDIYRKAYYNGSLDISVIRLRAGTFTLNFRCMPQKFYKVGDIPIEVSDGDKLENLSAFEAKPLIRVYGNGTLGIGTETLTITNNSTSGQYIDIDCDMMDCYRDGGATNCNSYVTLSSGEFPTLGPGETGITIGSGISKVTITPRWWTI